MWGTVVKIDRLGTVWVKVDGPSTQPYVLFRATIAEHRDLIVNSVVKVAYDWTIRGFRRVQS